MPKPLSVLLLIINCLHFTQTIYHDQNPCQHTCSSGTYIVKNINTNNSNCTISCIPCDSGFITNTTNATFCIKCPNRQVANPKRDECHDYEVSIYALSRPAGIIYVLMLAVTTFLIIISLIILTRRRNHQLVITSNYYGLCLFLIGCLFMLYSPIPLLAKPLVSSCSAYIAMFNIGLSAIFAVLISRSAYVNGYYGDDNEIIKGGCGNKPRATFIILVLIIQFLFLVVGLAVMAPQTLEIETSFWNIYYFECSNWASIVFWVAFGYNVALSLFGNFLSCSSTKMDSNCKELKNVLVSYLVFYTIAMLQIIIMFRVKNEALAEGQAILCVLYVLGFMACFIMPKLYVIMYCTKDDGITIKAEYLLHDQEHAGNHHHHGTSLIHAKDGYKTHVVGMKIKSTA
jgi:7 transmembrane sweet-taste receptor of 3 GCPR.